MTRALMVSHYFAGHRGGIEIVADALARELSGQGFDVAWLATGRPSESGANLRCRSLSASNLIEAQIKIPYPVLFPSAWRAIFGAAKSANIVVAHDALYMTTIVAYLAARRYRKPFVVVQHIGEVPYRSPVLRQLMSLANRLIAAPILRRADRAVFISSITQRHFANIKWNNPPAIIFNGVDTAIFSPLSNGTDIKRARQNFGLPVGGPVALFVGRFVEKKGLHVLERVAREHPDIVFAFAGWGDVDPSKWNLPNVHVFSSLSGSTLAPLYQASDLLLLPSVGEGFPLVVQEALACGLPVICGLDTANADPAAARLLVGLPVDPRDPVSTARAFAQSTRSVIACPNSAKRFERFEFARERYSWRHAGKSYADLFRVLIASHASQISADTELSP